VNAWATLDGAGHDRQSEIDRAWETLLRNQFHDILPGSSIAQVYAETAVEHARVRAELGSVRDAATTALTGPPTGAASAVVGSAAWPRTEVVARGDALLRVHAPAFGFAPLASAQSLAAADGAPPVSLVETAEGCWRLDNGLIRVDVDVRGEICGLIDLSTGRDFIAPGHAANALVLYEDRPLMWDAWDIDAFHADKPVALDALERIKGEVLGGGLRGEVVVHRRSGDTVVEQRLVLDAGARRLDISTDVDWRERNVLLRATFPCATGARHVTVGRPFGSVELPVHRNTSWEQARFEFVAHGWLDLSDGSGGIALLTDGTYGHSVDGSTIGLSLLKSAAWPDPSADEGDHRFRYALMPYAGTWQAAGVPRAAFELAYPLRLVDTEAHGSRSLLHVEGEAVIAETVKSADDGDGMVVRLVETHAASGVARLVLERPPASAHRCDLGEHPIEELTIHGREVVVPVGPHQVTTVRLRWDR
jgi:alpha-mannosidase